MNHQLLIPRRRSAFSPLSFGSDLALWLDPSYGVYTDRSTQLTAASSQYWVRTGISAAATGLNCGDTNWTCAGWAYSSDVTATRFIVAGSDGTTGFRLLTNAGVMYADMWTGTSVADTNPLTNNTWHFFCLKHDAVANTYSIQVDGHSPTVAATAGPGTTSNFFSIGSQAGVFTWGGRIDSVGFWNRLLTADEIASLRNSGAGKVYSDLTAAEQVSLAAWYEFDGDGLDAHGANDLTAVNSPTYTSGIASGAAGDGDVVSLVDARTGPNCGPPSYAGRPLWVANAGKPYFSFDGTNDGLQTASNISLGAFTIAGNFYASGAAGILVEHSANAAANDGSWIYGTTVQTLNANRSATVSTKDLSVGWAVDSTWRTIVHSHNGTQATNLLRLNGVNQTLSDATSNDVGTGTVADKLNIACRNQASLFSTMRLGDLVAVNRVLTAGELAQLESWLASRRAA